MHNIFGKVHMWGFEYILQYLYVYNNYHFPWKMML